MSADDDCESNWYAVLGVDPEATSEDIKASYQALLLRLHPDKTVGKKDTTGEDVHEVLRAWKVLGDEKKRRQYDARWRQQEQLSTNVWKTIRLEEMELQAEGDYCLDCRCGGIYLLQAEEAPSEQSKVSVECDTCSLSVVVTANNTRTN